MSVAAISLVLVSAFMHATWNLLARHRKSEMAFFSRMLLIIMAIGLLPVIAGEIVSHSIPKKAWLCALGSGFCGALYLYSLASAYRSSDFTVVYPVARALPVLLVGLGDVLRGRLLTPPGWVGLVLVAAGCLLTPLCSFREFSIRRYVHRSILWMMLAALGTVGYSLLDKTASEIVNQGPGTAAKYCYLFFSFSALFFFALQKAARTNSRQNDDVGLKLPAVGAVCFFGAYWLVLWTFQFTRHASYVVAFRQFSIIIGVVAAFFIYKERGVVVRLAGAVLITIGLVLVGVFGK